MNNIKNINTQKGFTLIEMVITVAIALVLLAIGVPGLKSWIDENKAAGYAESLAQGLQISRAQAISRGKAMIFTINNDQGWTSRCRTMIDIGTAGTEDNADDCIFAKTALGAKILPTNLSGANIVIGFGQSATSIISSEIAPPTTYTTVHSTTGGSVCALPCSITFNAMGMIIPNDDASASYGNTFLTNNQNAMRTAVIVSGAGQIVRCNPDSPIGSQSSC